MSSYGFTCPNCGAPVSPSPAGGDVTTESAYFVCGTGREPGSTPTGICRILTECRRRVEDFENRVGMLEQSRPKFADGQAVTWRGREARILRRAQTCYEITFVDEFGRNAATVAAEEQLAPLAVPPAALTVGEPVEVVYDPRIHGIIDVIRGRRALVYRIDRTWADHDINNLRRTSQDVSSLLK